MKCICKNVLNIVEESFLVQTSTMSFTNSIVCFMIIGLKEDVPCVVKVAPATFIDSELLKDELFNCLELLVTGGFNVRAAICENHAANVSAFTKLVLQFGEDNGSFLINFQSQKVSLFYDTVHLVKNVRNNILSKKQLVFHNSAFLSLIMML